MTLTTYRLALAGMGMALVIVAWEARSQSHLASHWEREATRLQSERVALEARLKEIPDHPVAATRPVSENASGAYEFTATGGDSDAPTTPEDPAAKELGQKAMAMGLSATVDQRYGRLFRKLKLSPQELGLLKDLLVERDMNVFTLLSSPHRDGETDDSRRNGIAKSEAEIDANIRAAVGDTRFTQFQYFVGHRSTYSLVDAVERRLSYSAAPLQESEAEALVTILEQNPVPSTDGGRATGGLEESEMQSLVALTPMAGMLGSKSISDQAIAAAHGVLSEAQVDVLREIQKEQMDQKELILSAATGARTSRSASTVSEQEAKPKD
jgi:hypothetical protein